MKRYDRGPQRGQYSEKGVKERKKQSMRWGRIRGKESGCVSNIKNPTLQRLNPPISSLILVLGLLG